MEGFFADPIYGGNREMVAWRMIGFPGVRYDFRDHVEKHNVKYQLLPVGVRQGRGQKAMSVDQSKALLGDLVATIDSFVKAPAS
jgi:gluconate 2-dehydrogenase gamma chain